MILGSRGYMGAVDTTAISSMVQAGSQLVQTAIASAPPPQAGKAQAASAGAGIPMGKYLVVGARKPGVRVLVRKVGRAWVVSPVPKGRDLQQASDDILRKAGVVLHRRYGTAVEPVPPTDDSAQLEGFGADDCPPTPLLPSAAFNAGLWAMLGALMGGPVGAYVGGVLGTGLTWGATYVGAAAGEALARNLRPVSEGVQGIGGVSEATQMAAQAYTNLQRWALTGSTEALSPEKLREAIRLLGEMCDLLKGYAAEMSSMMDTYNSAPPLRPVFLRAQEDYIRQARTVSMLRTALARCVRGMEDEALLAAVGTPPPCPQPKWIRQGGLQGVNLVLGPCTDGFAVELGGKPRPGQAVATGLGIAAPVAATIPVVGWIASAVLGAAAGIVSAVDAAAAKSKASGGPSVRPGVAVGPLMIGSKKRGVHPEVVRLASGVYVVYPARSGQSGRQYQDQILQGVYISLASAARRQQGSGA